MSVQYLCLSVYCTAMNLLFRFKNQLIPKMKLHLSMLLLLFCLSVSGQPQHTITRYSIEDGLPQQTIPTSPETETDICGLVPGMDYAVSTDIRS